MNVSDGHMGSRVSASRHRARLASGLTSLHTVKTAQARTTFPLFHSRDVHVHSTAAGLKRTGSRFEQVADHATDGAWRVIFQAGSN